MKIRNVEWVETDKYIQVTLRDPFWSAWQKYGWEKNVEGFGISLEAIRYAIRVNKYLVVKTLKYGKYEISPTEAYAEGVEMHNWKFVARDKKILVVLPRTSFKKIENEN